MTEEFDTLSRMVIFHEKELEAQAETIRLLADVCLEHDDRISYTMENALKAQMAVLEEMNARKKTSSRWTVREIEELHGRTQYLLDKQMDTPKRKSIRSYIYSSISKEDSDEESSTAVCETEPKIPATSPQQSATPQPPQPMQQE